MSNPSLFDTGEISPARSTPEAEPEEEPEPVTRIDRGGSYPERLTLADGLEELLVNEMSESFDSLCRRVVYSMYALRRSEFVRVVEQVINELRND